MLVAAVVAAGCGTPGVSPDGAKTVVVTYSILGSVVKDLVGDAANVVVLMPNGTDPHDWSPSAKDIERVGNADIVVANGLDLETGLVGVLEEAERNGVPVFRATDHVDVRTSGTAADGNPAGAPDPHFWLDPVSMQAVVGALGPAMATAGIDVADRTAALDVRLADLDAEVRSILDVVPSANRRLVTGHESMGYFADRYGFTLVGAVIPGLTSQGEVSAGALAELKVQIEADHVKAIFAEVGTPTAVAEAIGRETGVAVVELATHALPADGSYFTFLRGVATTIANALR